MEILNTAGFAAPLLVAVGYLMLQLRADRKQYAQLAADQAEAHQKEEARLNGELAVERAAHDAERTKRRAAEDDAATQRRRAEAAEAALLLLQPRGGAL